MMNRVTISALFLLLLIANLPAQIFSNPDTIKICAIRAEFMADENELTTGNGKFMVDTVTTDPYAIDPAPHNKLYFEDQIRAVSNYFNKVSKGRIILDGDVFPSSENVAYQLNNPMGYYNPNTTDEEINAGISQLFADAVSAADEDNQIHFDDYDLVVVFHAGVGRDIALDFDPTPQDIASLFITHEFLKNSFGADYEGVPADGGHVTQGILLPETENQEGEMIALTGIFASNIGTYLGLYDLFSPSKQRSGVGRFDLMDVGLLNLNGLIPSPPGAFSRMILGWDNPILVDQPKNQVQVANLSLDNSTAPTLIKIPINEDEYYLIEHRGDPDVYIDSLFIELAQDRDEYPSYLEVLKTYFADHIEIGESGVLLSVSNYDWGLPGAGILIWHIDERIIREKGTENKLNDDPNNRAVDIEEADGSQDIGQIYSFLEPGYQTELGTFADFWFSNRPENFEDFELYENEFSTNTAPNTRANLNNAISHITLNNFSTNLSEIMTFDFKRDIYESGFPVSLFTGSSEIKYIVSGSVQNEDSDFAFACTAAGDILAVGSAGMQATGLFASTVFRIAQLADRGAVTSLALVNDNGEPGNELLIAASGSDVYGFSLLEQDNSVPGMAKLEFKTNLAHEIISPVVVTAGRIVVSCSDLTGYSINISNPTEVSTFNTSAIKNDWVEGYQKYADIEDGITYAASAALHSSSVLELITFQQSTNTFSFFNEDGDLDHQFQSPVSLKGQFAIADLDGNATPDIVFNSGDGIYALNQQGNLLSGFPIRPTFGISDSLTGTPLLVDLDKSGLPDIIALTANGQTFAFTEKGAKIADYSLSMGGKISATPVILQLDSDAELELLAITNEGSCFAWQLPAENGTESGWFSENFDATNNILLNQYSAYVPISSALMPDNRAYNYPNPNKDDFTVIRYYLNENASVKIRIFDASGLLIDAFNGPGEGQVDNEIPWNVSAVASGVYLCKIEAKSGSASESKIIKIMVVH